MRQLKSYLFAFPTESAPILGQQLSINQSNFVESETRLNTFINQANINFPIPGCDLTFTAVNNNNHSSGLFDRNLQLFKYDDNQNTQTIEQLKQTVASSVATYTFSCQPWGSGERIALDRDRDGIFNSVEISNGSDPSNPNSSSFKPQTGLWYNPATSGRGLDLEISGNNLAVIWYTHREDGSPIWYLASATISQNWQADLLEFHWDPDSNSTTSQIVGSISLNFSNAQTAEINWNLGENSGSEPIQTLNFRPQPADMKLTGLWYDPNESGWGVSIATQGDTRVVIAYYYDENNLPKWSISQSTNDIISTQTPVQVIGACPWCQYTSPINNENGQIDLELTSFDTLKLNILQRDPETQNIQWQRNNSQFIRLTDTPY